jgi:hypothetical protein
MRKNNRPVIIDRMNISLKQPKPRVETTHTNVQKTRRERVIHQQNRGLRRQERSERTQGVQNAFVTLLLIVLFVIFSGLAGDVLPPTSRESVTSTTGSQDYIASIAPSVGENAVGSFEIILSILTPVARTAEFVVTNIGRILNALLGFINFFYTPLNDYDPYTLDDPTTICIPYEDVGLIQNINYTSSRLWYNFVNNQNLETNEDYHNYLQVQRYGEVYNEICA